MRLAINNRSSLVSIFLILSLLLSIFSYKIPSLHSHDYFQSCANHCNNSHDEAPQEEDNCSFSIWSQISSPDLPQIFDLPKQLFTSLALAVKTPIDTSLDIYWTQHSRAPPLFI